MYRNTKIQSFNTLLDELDRLRVQWGSCQDIPFVGWADVSFAIEDIEISVPMLVTTEHLNCPIIGFNVIKKIIHQGQGEHIVSILTKAFKNDKL